MSAGPRPFLNDANKLSVESSSSSISLSEDGSLSGSPPPPPPVIMGTWGVPLICNALMGERAGVLDAPPECGESRLVLLGGVPPFGITPEGSDVTGNTDSANWEICPTTVLRFCRVSCNFPNCCGVDGLEFSLCVRWAIAPCTSWIPPKTAPISLICSGVDRPGLFATNTATLSCAISSCRPRSRSITNSSAMARLLGVSRRLERGVEPVERELAPRSVSWPGDGLPPRLMPLKGMDCGE